MRFSIRDDDTNYFTRPEVLEACYGEIWDTCPVSLSVVPFHARTRSGAIPQEYWQASSQSPQESDEVFPIGNNKELVSFLREKVRRGQVCITLHGYSHKDVRPEPGGYEFEAGSDLDFKVRTGKQYLEEIFQVPIQVFVPPHNALSASAAVAAFHNELSLCGTVGWRAWRCGPGAWRNLFLRRFWRHFQGGPYPYPQSYGANRTLGYQSLTPRVSLDYLISVLEHYRRWDGWFCLATHHWEFGARQKTGEKVTMKEIFRDFWNKVTKISGIEFTSLNSIAHRCS